MSRTTRRLPGWYFGEFTHPWQQHGVNWSFKCCRFKGDGHRFVLCKGVDDDQNSAKIWKKRARRLRRRLFNNIKEET